MTFTPPPSRPPRPGPGTAPRILFLDDDPRRAETFLAEHPDAVWVETVAECLQRLEEEWDEVHLDHDLGGEHFVGHEREDCGMEVVRWLSLTPHQHLQRTRFLIHSHNPTAANLMGMQMIVNGYQVEVRPFGTASTSVSSTGFGAAGAPRRPLRVLAEALRGLLTSLLTPKRPALAPELAEHLRALRERQAKGASSTDVDQGPVTGPH